MEDRPDRYPVSVNVPVAWGDMDAMQHVNNTVYARWAETARILYFERLGLLDRMKDDGIGPILARLAIDYRRPVTFPDTVRVDMKTTRIGNRSFTMAFRVWSEDLQAEVAGGEQVIVVFDYRASRPAAVDDRLRAAIESLEANGG